MIIYPRVLLVRGTEAERLAIATYYPSLVSLGEQVYTTDQQRLWVKDTSAWVLLSAAKHLGSVEDEAAMLSLNDAVLGVWPGDTCLREDSGKFAICLTNNGEALEDWCLR